MTLFRILGCAVLALCVPINAPVAAAEQGRLSADAYRLNRLELDSYRLQTASPVAPVVEAVSATDLTPVPDLPGASASLSGRPYSEAIRAAATESQLDPALVHAIIYVESRYDPAARSPKGALGLMQVMPDTGLRYGVTNPGSSPEANLRAGTRYLRDLMKLFAGRLDLVLAAYNAGENAVIRSGWRIPPFRETRQYVPAVLAKYSEWREPPAPAPLAPKVAPEPERPLRVEYIPGTRWNSTRFPQTAP